MSEGNVPVWLHGSNGTATQIGTATPGDNEGVYTLDIWPAYSKKAGSDRISVGDNVWTDPDAIPEAKADPSIETQVIPDQPTATDASDADPANDNNTNAEPAEGALAEPKQQPTFRRSDANKE